MVIEGLVELRKSKFERNTLVDELFPPILEGRLRPQAILDQPLSPAMVNHMLIERLGNIGVRTLGSLLGISLDTFTSLSRFEQEGIKRGLNFYLSHRVAIGPEGYFLKAIFASSDYRYELQPLPVEHEAARRDLIWQSLDQLTSERKEVLVRRFGLTDGITRSYRQVGIEYGISVRGKAFSIGKIQGIEHDALRIMRHPLRSAPLSIFIPLPEDSVGRTVWAVDYPCQIELPPPYKMTNITIRDLDLDYPLLLRASFRNIALPTLLRMGTDQVPKALGPRVKRALEAFQPQQP